MRSTPIRLLAALGTVVAALLTKTTSATVGDTPVAAQPLDPVAAIVQAARTHPLVALGEGQRRNEQGHRFRLALVRDRRFREAFDDLVVAFGNARYQQVVDMFVNGEDIPDEIMRQVWENTTQPHGLWDAPIYEEFYRAVRDLNGPLPVEQRLRVVLADPPIDWGVVESEEEVLRWIDMRERFAVEVIRDQVLARQRRALLLFGDHRLWRHGEYPTIVSLLERSTPDTVFAIGTPTAANLGDIQASTVAWPVPSLTPLKDTVLGRAPFAPFYETSLGRLRGKPWEGLRLQDQFDALLYLGPPDSITIAPLPAARCGDTRYMVMRRTRLAMVSWGRAQLDHLRSLCTAYGPN